MEITERDVLVLGSYVMVIPESRVYGEAMKRSNGNPVGIVIDAHGETTQMSKRYHSYHHKKRSGAGGWVISVKFDNDVTIGLEIRDIVLIDKEPIKMYKFEMVNENKRARNVNLREDELSKLDDYIIQRGWEVVSEKIVNSRREVFDKITDNSSFQSESLDDILKF